MLDEVHARLVQMTAECREDMHEPDEQRISARVVGTELDNAFGERISPDALVDGYQEIIILLDNGDQVEKFNLADLIALARLAKPPSKNH